LGYSLRVNVKKLEASAVHPEREKQFDLIETQKQRFESANLPIISVDTKKKELIGNAQECWAGMGTAAILCQHA
jgi:Rhodopirellula transposase DDE domain